MKANLNWKEGENNELTQFGCKFSNLYSLSVHKCKNIKLAEEIPTILENLLSNLNKGSLTHLEETLLSQSRKQFLDQVNEFFSGIDMITERIDQLKGEIASQMKGHCDPVVMHYLEKGDAGQQHILKIILELLYPDGYDSISTPLRKATDSQDTEIVSSSTTCDSVTVTNEPKNDSSILDSHVQRKHFDTGSKYKSKANRKYGISLKLKFPRVDKKKFKFIKRAKGTKKNNSNSNDKKKFTFIKRAKGTRKNNSNSKVKSKIGYINKTNLNDFSSAMTFHNRLLLKWPRVKLKNKLY